MIEPPAYAKSKQQSGGIMRLSLLALSLIWLPFSASADVLRTNNFGDVFDGNSPFAVGKVNTSTAGRLVTDRFGDVYVEGSNFKVGHIDGVSSAGELYMDNFGDVYVKGNPFKVDAKEALNLKD